MEPFNAASELNATSVGRLFQIFAKFAKEG